MNIAIFTHNYPINKNDRKDAGIFVHDFAEKLRQHHNVFIFYPNYGNNEKFGNWSIFNPLSPFKFFKSINYGLKESAKFVKKNKIDYVLSAWAIPSGIYALFTKLKYNIPYGVWYLGSDLNIYSKFPVLSTLMYVISKRANNLFANSFALVKIAKSKYGKCVMLPASTNIAKNQKTTELKLGKRKTNILYVGRLEKVKGPDLLVEASRKLDNKFIIRVIGDGTMRPQIDNLSDRVEFLGYLGINEMTSYMKSSDFLIIPSRNESLPLVILEAANYNLPVLASNVGDCKYVLRKYNLGDTFEKENISQMVSKIKRFDFKYFRRNGQFNKAVFDYSLDNSINIFLKSMNLK